MLRRIDYAEPVRRRAIQNAIGEALAAAWTRRAEMFDWARPRPGDFIGLATPADLSAADERCAGVALACRNHADALAWGWFE